MIVITQRPGWVTAKEVALEFGLSLRTVERMTASGEIPSYHFRKSVRYDLQEIKNHRKTNEPKPH